MEIGTSLLSYVRKWRGQRLRSGTARPPWHHALAIGGGGALTIGLLHLLTNDLRWVACFMAPLGATCALVFGVPASPVAQPRNVIGGNVLAALVGLASSHLFGKATWWALALAIGAAMFLMAITRTFHPPAAVTVLLPLLTGITDWRWVLVPVTAGAIIVVVVAVVYDNLFSWQQYPLSWW